jgi:cytochrome c553
LFTREKIRRLPDAGRPTKIAFMKTIAEIEDAIERLSAPQVAELAAWLEQFQMRRAMQPPAETWLERARGAARPGVATEEVMALTRGEE